MKLKIRVIQIKFYNNKYILIMRKKYKNLNLNSNSNKINIQNKFNKTN